MDPRTLKPEGWRGGSVSVLLSIRIPNWVFAGLRQGAPQPPGRTSPLPPPKKVGVGAGRCGWPCGLNLEGAPHAPEPWPSSLGREAPEPAAVPWGPAAGGLENPCLGPVGQLHRQVWLWNLLYCRPVQLERKSLRVSAPSLTTKFLRGVWSAGPAVTGQCRTLRIP